MKVINRRFFLSAIDDDEITIVITIEVILNTDDKRITKARIKSLDCDLATLDDDDDFVRLICSALKIENDLNFDDSFRLNARTINVCSCVNDLNARFRVASSSLCVLT